jgi:hypothetical protein
VISGPQGGVGAVVRTRSTRFGCTEAIECKESA